MEHFLLHRFLQSLFSESRLCFQDLGGNPDVQNVAPQTPEQQSSKQMDTIFNAIAAIANTPGSANITSLRATIEAAQKISNPLLIKRLQDLQKAAMANQSISPLLLAVGMGQGTVPLTEIQRKEILNFIEQQRKAPIEQQQAKERKMTIQETQLRTKLLALKMQVELGNKQAANKEAASKETDVARKERLEREAKEVDSIVLAFEELQRVDPQGLTSLQQEIGITTEQFRLLVRPNIGNEQTRNSLTSALARIQAGNLNGIVDDEFNLSVEDVTQNLMSLTNTIVQSDSVRNGLNQLRTLTRGKVNINPETVARIVFQLVRGIVANFLATSSFVARFGPEVEGRARELGRGLHWRLSLETYLRTPEGRKLAAANGAQNGRLNFTQLTAMTDTQLESILLPSGGAVKANWEDLYAEWSSFAQERKANRQPINLPMPAIRDALSEGSVKDYKARLAKVRALPPPSPTTGPTENQPRTIESLIFNPPAFTLEVTAQQTLSVTVNGTRMDFTRDNNGIHVRLGGPTGLLRTFRTISGSPITSLRLMAPSTNPGDIQLRCNNSTEQGVTLTTLRERATVQENQAKATINFTNATTLAFAA